MSGAAADRGPNVGVAAPGLVSVALQELHPWRSGSLKMRADGSAHAAQRIRRCRHGKQPVRQRVASDPIGLAYLHGVCTQSTVQGLGITIPCTQSVQVNQDPLRLHAAPAHIRRGGQ